MLFRERKKVPEGSGRRDKNPGLCKNNKEASQNNQTNEYVQANY